MKRIIAIFFAVFSILAVTVKASAQTAESIWLTANNTAYKTGETVSVALNATSATPIQGFTFQIRYDPACLQPTNASSPVPGMNGLPLPQVAGLADGSYASTTPQAINGVLAEVRFTALKGCQTNLTLESAALAVRSAEGFAAPLPGVLIGEKNLSLNIDRQAVAPQPAQAQSGSILPLTPPKQTQGNLIWIIGMIGLIFAVLVGSMMFGALSLLQSRKPARVKAPPAAPQAPKPILHVKHGPHAGKSLSLNRLPILIGRDPQSDICINDPHVINQHAQIYSNRNGYCLRDLGGGTVVNGHPLKSSAVVLHSGDVVRLGKSFLFVFG